MWVVVATWARVRVAGMVAGMGMGRARVRVRVYLCGGREGLRDVAALRRTS